jgi:hypothetical protein
MPDFTPIRLLMTIIWKRARPAVFLERAAFAGGESRGE